MSLFVTERLHAGSSVKADFIYIDPPFYSGANYKARIVEDGEVKTPEAYSDKWDSFADFLEALKIYIFSLVRLEKQEF